MLPTNKTSEPVDNAALLRVNETLEHRIEDRTKELADALKQAEKASTTKSEFLANSLKSASESAAHTTASTSLDSGNALPDHLFDVAQFEEMQMIMGDKFFPLLKQFSTDSLLQIQGMREAATSNDAEAMRKCAHKLKGSAGSIGATVLTKVCHCMEECARSGNIDGAAEAIESIAVCLDEVLATIDSLADQ